MGGMLIAIAAVIFVIIIGITAIGVFAAKRIGDSDRIADGRTFRPSAESQAEWGALTARHDPGKGDAERYASSEAYKLCTSLHWSIASRLRPEKGQPVVTRITIDAGTLENAERLDPEAHLKENYDIDELKEFFDAVKSVHAMWPDLKQDADRACSAAYDSSDARERSLCKSLLEESFEMLEPVLHMDVAYRTGDGRRGMLHKKLGAARLAALCGLQPPEIKMLPGRRAELLAKDGFRCRRCGRSPLSGGHIEPVAQDKDNNNAYAALCEDCGGKAGMS